MSLIENFVPVVKYQGFNTDKAAVLGSTLAVAGAVTLSSTLAVTGNIDASAATLKHKRNVLASSGNTTMTAAMSGSVMLIDGATTAYALPAITAADVGMEFWFVTTATSSAATITAGAADILTGGVMCMSTGAGIENDAFSANGSSDLVITMNGTTKGGIIGSTWHIIALSATSWYCDGTTIGSGTLVTPFS